MYALPNIFFIASLSWLYFITSVFSETNAIFTNINIRERGSNSTNIEPGNVTSNSSLTNNVSPISVNFLQSKSSKQKMISEGGSVSSTVETHTGGETVLELPATKNTSVILTKSEVSKPVHDQSSMLEVEVPPQQDHKKPIVPKKGVKFPDAESPLNHTSSNSSAGNSSSNSSTKSSANLSDPKSSPNSTVIHKKPLVTESDSDYIDITKSIEDASKENPITIDQIDPALVNKIDNHSDYIIPIVAVILSVPLVAILISVVYKRSTDWWQHRNYKRINFLIEGMYHN